MSDSMSLGKLMVYFGADDTELRHAMREAENAVRGAMGDIERTTNEASKGVEQLTKAEKEANLAMKEVSKASKEVASAQKEASREIEKTTTESKELSAAADEASAAGKDLNNSMKDVSKATKESADSMDKMEKETRDAKNETKDMDTESNKLVGTLKKKAIQLAAMYLGYQTLKAVVRETVGTLVEFEYSMSTVAAVTGATSADMAELTRTARQLGATTRYSGAQAAEGMRFLGMAGFDTNEIVMAMPGMLDLATVGLMDLASAADIASNILSGFQLPASEATKIADILAVAANSANTSVAQMGDGMKYVAPIASAMSIDVEKVAGAIGILSDAGIQGSMAGTGLRQVLSGLANVTPQASSVLEKYKINVEDINPATHDLIDVIELLSKAGLSAADALTVFGDRGAPALLAMTSQVPRLRELIASLYAADGAAKEMTKTVEDNLKGDWLEFQSALEETIHVLNDKTGLTHWFRTATQAATEFVRSVSSGDVQTIDEMALSIMRLEERLQGGSTNRRAMSGLTRQLRELRKEFDDATRSANADAFVDSITSIDAQIADAEARIASHGTSTRKKDSRGRWRTTVVDIDIDAEKTAIDDLLRIRDDMYSRLEDKAREHDAELSKSAAEADQIRKAKEKSEKASKIAEAEGALKSIRDLMKSEKEVIEDSYNDRKRIILTYTRTEEAIKKELAAATDEVTKNALEEELRDREKLLEGIKDVYSEELRLLEEKESAYSDYRKGIEREIEMLAKRNWHIAEGVKETDRYFRIQKQYISSIGAAGTATQGDNTRINALGDILGTFGGVADLHMSQGQEMSKFNAAGSDMGSNFDTQMDLQAELFMQGEQSYAEYYGNVESLTAEHNKAMNELEKSKADATKEHRDQMTVSMIGAASDIAMSMSKMMKDGSREQKAFFLLSRALLIAQTLMYTHMAAARVPAEAGPFLGIPMAKAVLAFGYAQAGMIAGQTIASFDGGGMTPTGSRVGGMDGKGGFLSVLHPNEKVTDLTRTYGNDSRSKTELKVVVHNYGNESVEVQQNQNGDMVEIFVGVERHLAGQADRGQGPLVNAMERRYKSLKRN